MSRTQHVLVGASAALLLAACGGSANGEQTEVAEDVSFEEGTTMARLAEQGSVTVGVAFDKPYFGLRGLDGEMEGFDVEMAKAIAGELGIEPADIEWVETVSANREPFIEQGKVDYVIATYTINEERKKVVSFAGPYFVAGQAIIVPKGNPQGIESIEDVNGERLCGVTGSTGYEHIRSDYPNAAKGLTGFDTYSKCGDALANGQVDVVTADNTTLAGIMSDHEGEFELVGEPFSQEPYGVAFAKDDVEFQSFVNEVLQEMMDDGRWTEIYESTAGEILGEDIEPPQITETTE
nr:glutamate ABC transporter substrate-binding protein [Ornithinimicrobium cavernae]